MTDWQPPTPPEGWNARLLEQLTFHWDTHLWPKLEGLTDAEYFWEPVPGMWSVRPRAESTAPLAGGGGHLVAEFAHPEPDPVPVTTIAWRLAHLTIGCFGERAHNHFGGPAVDYMSYEYSPTAAGAVAELRDAYQRWVDGVRGLGDDGLEQTVGAAEGIFAAFTYADLVLHIHREVIHHGAEILLLRDLHRTWDR